MTTPMTTAAHVRCDVETRDAIAELSRRDGLTQGAWLRRVVLAERDRLTTGDHTDDHSLTTPVTTGDHTDDHSAQAVETAALSAKLDAVTRERDRAWSDLEAARQDLARALDSVADLTQAVSAQAQAHAIAQAAARSGLAERLRRLLGRS